MAAEVPTDVYIRNLYKIFRGHDGDADSISHSVAMVDGGSLTRPEAYYSFLARADPRLYNSDILAAKMCNVLLGREPPAGLPGLTGYELLDHVYTLMPAAPAAPERAPPARAPSAHPPSVRPPAPSAERDDAAGVPLPAPRAAAAAERAPSARPPSVRPASVRPASVRPASVRPPSVRPPPGDDPSAPQPAHAGGRAGSVSYTTVVATVATVFVILAIAVAVFDIPLPDAALDAAYGGLLDMFAASKALMLPVYTGLLDKLTTWKAVVLGAAAAAAAVVGL